MDQLVWTSRLVRQGMCVMIAFAVTDLCVMVLPECAYQYGKCVQMS